MKRLLGRMDKPLLLLTIIMFIFGSVMILSISSIKAAVIGNPYIYFIKHMSVLLLGFIAFIIIVNIPLKSYKRILPLAVYLIIFALFFVYSYGVAVHSAKRWIDMGIFAFQPSEFAKTILILYMGNYYLQHYRSKKAIVLFKPLLLGLIIFVLTFLQPDLGTASIILGIIVFIFLSLPLEKNFKRRTIQIGILGLVILVLTFAFNRDFLLREGQLERFVYKNPCQRYTEKTGYQVCNGFIAINNGGLLGVGLGNSTQKYLYLPAAHTDFIFPVIVEELGLVTGLIILFIYLYILYRILLIANRSYNLMGGIIAYGVAIYLFLHISVNLIGVLGLFLLTGAPIPFLSYGGSYVLNLIISLAFVQRVETENNIYLKKRIIKQGL